MSNSEIQIYRTKDGQADYKFKFETMPDGKERAYILSQPSYRGRSEGGHETHRFGLDAGSPYICFDPMPRSRKDSKFIASAWADKTQEYIKTGRSF
jgi:hypothetical protein